MEAFLWKTNCGDNDIFCQIDVSEGIRKFKQIKKLTELSKWESVGEGFSIHKERYTLLLSKKNPSKEFMKEWFQAFPGQIYYIKDGDFNEKPTTQKVK